MAEETVQTPEQADAEFEQELASVMNPETATVVPAADAAATPPETSPAPVESSEEKPPEVVAEPTLEEKLAKIEEPKAEEAKPQLAPDQEKILAAIPTMQAAQELVTAAESYRQLDTALSAGDFAKVEQMFAPAALERFHEHVYQKYMGQWVDRWISEQEGNPVVNQGIRNLEQKVGSLQAKLDAEEQSKRHAAYQQRVAEVGRQYDAHIKNMFDLIEFADSDRRWVRAALDKLVGEDPNALRAINAGQMSVINPLFKQAVKEYVQKDQATAQGKEKQKAAEAKHKPLVSGSAITPVDDTVTDEMIRQAPAAQRDALIEKQYEQGLARLFSPRKK